MARWLRVVAVIALLASVGACETKQPAYSLRPAPSAPPAQLLLSRPQASNLNDFRITYTAHQWAEGPLSRSNGSITVRRSGIGSVDVKSTLMAKFHETTTFCLDQCPSDLIVIGEDRYSKSGGSSWWLAHGVAADTYLWEMVLPAQLAKAIAPRVVGQETLNGVETWVVDAIDPNGHSFRAWLGQVNGYPIQLKSAPNEHTSFLDIRINLDSFNTGVLVAAPPKDQLDPRFWGAEYVREQPIPIEGGTVTIHPAAYNCNGGDIYDDSRPDVYSVLVPFTYTAGPKRLTVEPGSWTLYDTFGHPYGPQSLGSAPKLQAQSIAGGHSVSGSLCFLVPWSQDNLTIVGNFSSGVVTSSVGGLRRSDS